MLTPEEVAVAKRGNPRIIRPTGWMALQWGHREEL